MNLIDRDALIAELEHDIEIATRDLNNLDLVETERAIVEFDKAYKENTIYLLRDTPSAHPELDEWCTDCKEYDHERHCCPRYNRVIRESLAEISIIRCKDCKHRPSGTGVNHDIEFPHDDYKCPCRCEDFWYSWMPDDDWYCANGERRTDG